ncbi:unnamed protein product [Acanthoscelides obtectus]|uniref:Uncharacterized protein n=1 Tax=Acanthoscelides obtectus TaxID=200917 RepID=A0A9P0KC94_ACAOB|nr:unnamed protein product [Acanthoscelides obtectus]CAK1651727.1 hypothetical protein AOBTE_LOCUS17415 [Acanthoscelides obtectus]
MSLPEAGAPPPLSDYHGRTGPPYYGGVGPSSEHSPYHQWTHVVHQHHRHGTAVGPGQQSNYPPYYDPGGHVQEPRRFAEAGWPSKQVSRKLTNQEDVTIARRGLLFLRCEFPADFANPHRPQYCLLRVCLMAPLVAPVAVESAYRKYDRALLPQLNGMR